MTPEKTITIALDGTGGDKVDGKSIASAVRFAVVLCPNLKVLVFGDQDLKVALEREKIHSKAYEFISAPECIPQDEDPRSVLVNYKNSYFLKKNMGVRDKK